jgi:hypothetical protein
MVKMSEWSCVSAAETAELELELELEPESSLESELTLVLVLELELEPEPEHDESSDELFELELLELEVVDETAVAVCAAIVVVLAAFSTSCAWCRCASAWWAMLKWAGVMRPSRLSHARTASRGRRRLPRNRAASLAKSALMSFPGNFIEGLHNSKLGSGSQEFVTHRASRQRCSKTIPPRAAAARADFLGASLHVTRIRPAKARA